jgi:hypothetical protein
MDPSDFGRNVRRDDYGAHVASFGLAGASVLVAILFESAWLGLLGMGGGLVLSGFFALRGRKSAVTRVSGLGVQARWTTRQLEGMSPSERASHAGMTGALLVSFGVTLVGMGVWSLGAPALGAFDSHRTGADEREVAGGTGLAIAAGVVVWDQPIGLGFAPVLGGSQELLFGPEFHRGVTFAADGPRLAVASSEGLVTLEVEGDKVVQRTTVSSESALAVDLDGEQLVWIDTRGLHLGQWSGGTAKPLEAEPLVATHPPVVAVVGERVFFGPTERCGLAEIGRAECIADVDAVPCALARDSDEIAFVTKRNGVYVVDVSSRTAIGTFGESSSARRIAEGVKGCALAFDGDRIFVVSSSGVTRIRPQDGNTEHIYELPHRMPVTAAAAKDGWLFFRGEQRIHRLRTDAPELH